MSSPLPEQFGLRVLSLAEDDLEHAPQAEDPSGDMVSSQYFEALMFPATDDSPKHDEVVSSSSSGEESWVTASPGKPYRLEDVSPSLVEPRVLRSGGVDESTVRGVGQHCEYGMVQSSSKDDGEEESHAVAVNEDIAEHPATQPIDIPFGDGVSRWSSSSSSSSSSNDTVIHTTENEQPEEVFWMDEDIISCEEQEVFDRTMAQLMASESIEKMEDHGKGHHGDSEDRGEPAGPSSSNDIFRGHPHPLRSHLVTPADDDNDDDLPVDRTHTLSSSSDLTPRRPLPRRPHQLAPLRFPLASSSERHTCTSVDPFIRPNRPLPGQTHPLFHLHHPSEAIPSLSSAGEDLNHLSVHISSVSGEGRSFSRDHHHRLTPTAEETVVVHQENIDDSESETSRSSKMEGRIPQTTPADEAMQPGDYDTSVQDNNLEIIDGLIEYASYDLEYGTEPEVPTRGPPVACRPILPPGSPEDTREQRYTPRSGPFCTHETLLRSWALASTFKCQKCGNTARWLWTCTADTPDNSPFDSHPEPVRRDVSILAPWMQKAIAKGEYTEAQVEKLLDQKVKVLELAAQERCRATQQQAGGSTGIADAAGEAWLASATGSRARQPTDNDDSGLSTSGEAIITSPPEALSRATICRLLVCAYCYPRCIEQGWGSIDAIVNGPYIESPRIPEYLTRPISDATTLRAMNEHCRHWNWTPEFQQWWDENRFTGGHDLLPVLLTAEMMGIPQADFTQLVRHIIHRAMTYPEMGQFLNWIGPQSLSQISHIFSTDPGSLPAPQPNTVAEVSFQPL
ncbi:uncharacterized protein N7482_006613 [Penicillium canariense]|uniref:Uncharacterized protein n=1 Tax=Penicillium canariense TaxID=189055 RepID=A0A9W9HWP1_9EURO|nr:uncharacterized protein N7482_006613 [Penicillium canariense]KAJ5159609.1 hypothetical protein N7482_006613 [Penicillium canariense]